MRRRKARMRSRTKNSGRKSVKMNRKRMKGRRRRAVRLMTSRIARWVALR